MEYTAYPQRWILLVILCVISFSQVYSASGFVILNNVVAYFYGVSPYSTDMLAIVGAALGFPVGLASAYFSDMLSLRSLMLGLTTALLSGSLICVIGFLSRDLFYVTACGRVIMSCTFGTMFTTQVLLAARWFPSRESAMAYSLPVITLTCGSAASSLIYPTAIPRLIIQNITNENATIIATSWEQVQQVTILFGSTFGTLTISSLICLVLAIIFCKNQPPSPPSRAQEKLLSKIAEAKPKAKSSRLSEMWNIVRKRAFVLTSFGCCLQKCQIAFSVILLPSSVLMTFPDLKNTVPGQIALISTIGQAIGVTIAGKLLDRFKAFKLTILAGLSIVAASCIGLFFAHTYKNLTCLYILYASMNFGGGTFLPSSVELLVETTYPSNKLLLMSIYTSFSSLSLFIFVTITRIIMMNFGVPVAAASTAGFLLLSFIVLCMVPSDYKRQKADDGLEYNLDKNRSRTKSDEIIEKDSMLQD